MKIHQLELRQNGWTGAFGMATLVEMAIAIYYNPYQPDRLSSCLVLAGVGGALTVLAMVAGGKSNSLLADTTYGAWLISLFLIVFIYLNDEGNVMMNYVGQLWWSSVGPVVAIYLALLWGITRYRPDTRSISMLTLASAALTGIEFWVYTTNVMIEWRVFVIWAETIIFCLALFTFRHRKPPIQVDWEGDLPQLAVELGTAFQRLSGIGLVLLLLWGIFEAKYFLTHWQGKEEIWLMGLIVATLAQLVWVVLYATSLHYAKRP